MIAKLPLPVRTGNVPVEILLPAHFATRSSCLKNLDRDSVCFQGLLALHRNASPSLRACHPLGQPERYFQVFSENRAECALSCRVLQEFSQHLTNSRCLAVWYTPTRAFAQLAALVDYKGVVGAVMVVPGIWRVVSIAWGAGTRDLLCRRLPTRIQALE